MTKGRKVESIILRVLIFAAAAATFAVLLFLLAYILINGLPNIKPSLFSLEYNTENASLMPALVNTVIMTALSLRFHLVFSPPFSLWSTQKKEINLWVSSGLRRRLYPEFHPSCTVCLVCCFSYQRLSGDIPFWQVLLPCPL